MKSSNPTSLYIHIPFCKNICSYCDFTKFIYNQELVDKYLESLFLHSRLLNHKYKTIYIGGGSPSSLRYDNLEYLLSFVSKLLDDKYLEFCIECNVEDINEKILSLFVKYKINRLSIGVQSFNDKFIKYAKRKHTKEMAINNIKLASKYIKNISIDLIFAFQGETINDIKNDLDIAILLPITHLSYYSLLIEPHTILYNENVANVDDNIQALQYKFIYNYLASHHFNRYEISSFAKYKKYRSAHNLTYWHDNTYDAIGIAASGYDGKIRYSNTKNLTKYINGDFNKYNIENIDINDKMYETIMLNLRLDDGLDIDKFNKKFHVDFKEKYKDAIAYNKQYKLITVTKNKIKTTLKGSLLLNDVLVAFLDK